MYLALSMSGRRVSAVEREKGLTGLYLLLKAVKTRILNSVLLCRCVGKRTGQYRKGEGICRLHLLLKVVRIRIPNCVPFSSRSLSGRDWLVDEVVLVLENYENLALARRLPGYHGV